MTSSTTIADIATKISGIANNGAVSKTITPSTSQAIIYTIPAGYYNGSGKVTVSKVNGDITHNVYAAFSVSVASDHTYRDCILRIYKDGVQVTSKSWSIYYSSMYEPKTYTTNTISI